MTEVMLSHVSDFDLRSETYEYMKAGDTFPPLTVSLRRSDRVSIDTSSISTVNFSMRDYLDPNAIPKVDHQPCIITNSTQAEMQYQWQSTDTSSVGAYIAEWQILYESGDEETFPRDIRFVILVEADI